MIELARGLELGDLAGAAIGLDLHAIQSVALEDVDVDVGMVRMAIPSSCGPLTLQRGSVRARCRLFQSEDAAGERVRNVDVTVTGDDHVVHSGSWSGMVPAGGHSLRAVACRSRRSNLLSAPGLVPVGTFTPKPDASNEPA